MREMTPFFHSTADVEKLAIELHHIPEGLFTLRDRAALLALSIRINRLSLENMKPEEKELLGRELIRKDYSHICLRNFLSDSIQQWLLGYEKTIFYYENSCKPNVRRAHPFLLDLPSSMQWVEFGDGHPHLIENGVKHAECWIFNLPNRPGRLLRVPTNDSAPIPADFPNLFPPHIQDAANECKKLISTSKYGSYHAARLHLLDAIYKKKLVARFGIPFSHPVEYSRFGHWEMHFKYEWKPAYDAAIIARCLAFEIKSGLNLLGDTLAITSLFLSNGHEVILNATPSLSRLLNPLERLSSFIHQIEQCSPSLAHEIKSYLPPRPDLFCKLRSYAEALLYRFPNLKRVDYLIAALRRGFSFKGYQEHDLELVLPIYLSATPRENSQDIVFDSYLAAVHAEVYQKLPRKNISEALIRSTYEEVCGHRLLSDPHITEDDSILALGFNQGFIQES